MIYKIMHSRDTISKSRVGADRCRAPSVLPICSIDKGCKLLWLGCGLAEQKFGPNVSVPREYCDKSKYPRLPRYPEQVSFCHISIGSKDKPDRATTPAKNQEKTIT